MKLLVVSAQHPSGPRSGNAIADWFVERGHASTAASRSRWPISPRSTCRCFDEPEHPSLGQLPARAHQGVEREGRRAADAFVFVMPEYNHSYNAALKNAIDYLNREWAYKPVGFVSYGGVSGGLRAVQAIKPVVAALRMTPVVDAVTVPMAKTMIEADGFHPNDIVAASAKPMLDELVELARALLAPRRARSRLTPALARRVRRREETSAR